jgi:hypothetical protein
MQEQRARTGPAPLSGSAPFPDIVKISSDGRGIVMGDWGNHRYTTGEARRAK